MSEMDHNRCVIIIMAPVETEIMMHLLADDWFSYPT